MKKTFFMGLLLLQTLFSQTLHKAESFEQAMEQAQDQDKLLMVLITQDNCRYCTRMKKTTFSDAQVIERINEKYIFVEINRYKDSYPQDLTVFGVPTTYFLYNDGRHIMRGVGGFWEKEDFLSFMDDADHKLEKQSR